MFVYCVHNTLTGKRYIGVTTGSVLTRWKHHRWRAEKGAKTALYSAMRRDGFAAFVVLPLAQTLPDATVEDLFDLERALIAQEGTLSPGGYNMTLGGDGTIGYQHTDEQKAARAKRVVSIETRFRMSLSRLGREHSPETRALISKNRKGKPGGGAWRGQKLSEQHKAKMKAAWTPERRTAQAARMSALRKAA